MEVQEILQNVFVLCHSVWFITRWIASYAAVRILKKSEDGIE